MKFANNMVTEKMIKFMQTRVAAVKKANDTLKQEIAKLKEDEYQLELEECRQQNLLHEAENRKAEQEAEILAQKAIDKEELEDFVAKREELIGIIEQLAEENIALKKSLEEYEETFKKDALELCEYPKSSISHNVSIKAQQERVMKRKELDSKIFHATDVNRNLKQTNDIIKHEKREIYCLETSIMEMKENSEHLQRQAKTYDEHTLKKSERTNALGWKNFICYIWMIVILWFMLVVFNTFLANREVLDFDKYVTVKNVN